MNYEYMEIQELLQQRADLRSRLRLLPYDGSPEIKERGSGRYLYIRKRAAVIFANHYLTGRAAGLLVIPEKDVPEFKRLLVAYYEGRDGGEIARFMKEK